MNRNMLSPDPGVGEARGSETGFGEGFRQQQIKKSVDRCGLTLTKEASSAADSALQEAAASLNAAVV